MVCRYCGSDQVEYIGAVDGGGDYGEAVCDEWQCHHCDNRFDGDCIGGAVDGVFDADVMVDDEPEIQEYDYDNATSGDVGEIPF